jgi:P27 family predicted phage terminase small subunit
LKNTAPQHLSKEARNWWRQIRDEYSISDKAGLLLLQTALEAFDRMKAAQSRINTDGEAVEDRFGQIKPHPLLPAERDARAQMLAALKALNLDVQPVKPSVGKPPGTWNFDDAD